MGVPGRFLVLNTWVVQVCLLPVQHHCPPHTLDSCSLERVRLWQ